MEKRRLGKSDLYVNPIGMGCWAYGGGAYWGEQNQNDVNDVVHKALDYGVNLFDTAEMYNDGASETSLGIALKSRRQEAIICSKISPSNAYPNVLREHCEASLRRLGTDYIDIYMLHWPIAPIAIKHFTDDIRVIENPPSVQDAFDTLVQLQNEGKIREIGISNFGVEQMKEVLATGARVILNEMPYNVLSRAIEKYIIPFAIKNDMAIIGSMTLQQGLLAGIYETVESVPSFQSHSRHFNNEHGGSVSRHGEGGAEEEMFDTIDQLKGIASELDVHIAQLSIAWAIAKPGMKCALVGSRNDSELQSNIVAGELKLSTEIITRIDKFSESVLLKLGNNPDYYENTKNSRIR